MAIVSEPAGCTRCAELRAWTTARGPGAVLERVREMLARTEHGFVEVPHPPDSAGRPTIEWSQVPPAALTTNSVAHGWMTDGRWVDSSMAIRCAHCGRQYLQSWAFDRGAERWRITEADEGSGP